MPDSVIGETRRVTVRLDRKRTTRLVSLCQETGCDRSEVVRRAIDQFKVASVQRATDPKSMADISLVKLAVAENAPVQNGSAATSIRTGSPKEIAVGSGAPALFWRAKLLDLLNTYRSFGMQIWRERRSLYQRLFAASVVAGESNEDPRDIALCETLRRIGEEYNLF